VRRALGFLAIAAVAAAAAWPMQVTGDNQNAHYALVKALARGVPYVDETLRETGDLQSHDVARADGHLYAVRAPGLAMAATPTYLAVEAVGMRTTGDPSRVLWVLNVMTSVLATIVLLLLVRDLAERIEPGFGAATAVILGLGALTLPFATLFFSHALGTALVFAAFWVLWREREGPGRAVLVGAAGLLAGLAVTVEHPAIWIGAILALYAMVRRPRVVRCAAFAAGGLVGVLPWLGFNSWAFGNPFHTAYSDYWAREQNFSLLALPSWVELSRIFFSSLGLLTLAPVLAAGVVGMVLLYRRGLRAEALVCAAVPVVVILYFAGDNAYGGLGPPRYLTPMMPFALLPVAAALRRLPATTLALAAVGCMQAVVMTATGPLAAYDGAWLSRAADRLFVSTAASLVGISGWYAIAPFFLAALVGAVLAIASLPRLAVSAADVGLALVAVGAWAVAALSSYNDWGRTPSVAYVVTVVVVLALLTAALAAVTRLPRGPAAQPAAR
jgi:hypothetical protein